MVLAIIGTLLTCIKLATLRFIIHDPQSTEFSFSALKCILAFAGLSAVELVLFMGTGLSALTANKGLWTVIGRILFSVVASSSSLGLSLFTLIGYGIGSPHNRVFFWFNICTLLAFFYLLPSIVAFVRNHPNKYAILILNYLAGWIFIPWVVSLVWASLARRD